MTDTPARPAIEIGGQVIAAGSRVDVELPVARLPTGTPMSLPIAVLHGRDDGPAMWVSGALHGDELNGVEICRSVLAEVAAERLAGTLFVVPTVNVFGVIERSRYLPDRRDLNRAFPGSPRGSLAARLAHLFLNEVVSRCEYGVDLHCASDRRYNLPQIRCDADSKPTLRIARAFGAPVTIHARELEGTLRKAARSRGAHVLLFEGGSTHRFEQPVIDRGLEGVLRVLMALGMIHRRPSLRGRRTRLCRSTHWMRAPRGGFLRLRVSSGDQVRNGQIVGDISDSFDRDRVVLRARRDGLVIGHTADASVHQGHALLHIADLDEPFKPSGAS
jgi:predicted deacylase